MVSLNKALLGPYFLAFGGAPLDSHEYVSTSPPDGHHLEVMP